MTNRFLARGSLKEKDAAKLDDGSIFKLFSPAHESIANADSILQDKPTTQKAIHLPPLRIKTIRNTKTAASLRGITSESLKQILKESINFSERLSDVQLLHRTAEGMDGHSIRDVAQSLIHESSQTHHSALMFPATSQSKITAPIDVKNFQLALAPTTNTGRVCKPSRLVVSNQNISQNGMQPVAPKPNTPSTSITNNASRASSRRRKVVVKYFGHDKTEHIDGANNSDRTEETLVENSHTQMQIPVTCFDIKSSDRLNDQVPEILTSTYREVLGSQQTSFTLSEKPQPVTSFGDRAILQVQP
jgi:hypothetical protein